MPFKKTTSLFALLVSLIFCQSNLGAQENGEVEEEELLTMNMPDLDIRSLVQWAVDYLDKNIVVHRSVQGNVTILADTPLTRDEAWEVFLSALQINGFTVVETDNITRIIPASEATQANIPLVGPEASSDSSEMVIKLIELDNIAASRLVTILGPLISQAGLLTPIDDRNTLIIADYANNLSRIESIIGDIDQSSSLEVEIIPLENSDASQVVNILNILSGANTNEPANRVSLAVDERTNSILMSGNMSRRQELRGIMASLDRQVTASENNRVVYIQYVNASDLAPIVRSVMESLRNGQRNESFTATDISIEATNAPNALIINAPPQEMAAALNVIQQLDIRRAQVLVEAIIVEVNQNKVNELGIIWNADAGNIGGDGTASSATTLGSGLRDALETGDSGSIDMNLLGTGFTLGYYREGTLRAMLRALGSNNAANILSTPSILTLDNEEAKIVVGSNVPFITGSRETSGSENLFTTIERRDIGVTLTITPQVNNGDSITLTINQTTESVTDRAQAADIQTDKREISTKVIIYDEDILVLGGLISDSVVETETKVPLLGDTPLLGHLFKGSKSSTEKNNLMVFIHARILKDQLDGNAITRQRYNDIRSLQTEFIDATNEFGPFDSEEDVPLLPEFELYRPEMEPVPVED